jgi:hypothetical protein
MFQLDFVFVHTLVTDGRFLSAGSYQLHQDLEGHRPNRWQEVGGLDVRKIGWSDTAMQVEQVYRQKWRYKKVMKF